MTKLQLAMRSVLSMFLVMMGILHFTHASIFASIVPPYLPYPLLLVYLSGVIEIGLGVLLSIPRTQRFAAFSLIALFVAVFPANVHMALHPELEIVGKPDWMPQPSATAAWLRLPLQLVLIYWAWIYARIPTPAR